MWIKVKGQVVNPSLKVTVFSTFYPRSLFIGDTIYLRVGSKQTFKDTLVRQEISSYLADKSCLQSAPNLYSQEERFIVLIKEPLSGVCGHL